VNVAIALALALLAQPEPPDAPSPSGARESDRSPEQTPPAAPDDDAPADRSQDPVERLRQAVRADPNDAAAWAGLGAELVRSGRLDEAVEPLRTAVSLDPEANDARYNLAYTLRELDRLDAAAAAYRAYVERSPNDADAWYALGQTEEDRGRLVPAASAYERYTRVETRGDRDRWVERARRRAAALRARAGGPATSESSAGAPDAVTRSGPPLREADRDPGRRPTSLAGALAALEAHDYDRALRALKRDVPTPKTGFELAAYGSAQLGRGDLDAAAQSFGRAAETLRGRARAGALLGRAEALGAMNRREAAQPLYRRVVELDDEAGPWAAIARRRLAEWSR